MSEEFPNGRVIIARDITDRVRRLEAEKAALSATVARDKDEEANRVRAATSGVARAGWGCGLGARTHAHPKGMRRVL